VPAILQQRRCIELDKNTSQIPPYIEICTYLTSLKQKMKFLNLEIHNCIRLILDM